MSTGKKKLSLAFWIFLALIFGAGIGWGLVYVPGGAAFATKFIKPIGTIFVNLLKFIVVPIVLFSMVCGMMPSSAATTRFLTFDLIISHLRLKSGG